MSSLRERHPVWLIFLCMLIMSFTVLRRGWVFWNEFDFRPVVLKFEAEDWITSSFAFEIVVKILDYFPSRMYIDADFHMDSWFMCVLAPTGRNKVGLLLSLLPSHHIYTSIDTTSSIEFDGTIFMCCVLAVIFS